MRKRKEFKELINIEKFKKNLRAARCFKLDFFKDLFKIDNNILFNSINEWQNNFNCKIDKDYVIVDENMIEEFIENFELFINNLKSQTKKNERIVQEKKKIAIVYLIFFGLIICLFRFAYYKYESNYGIQYLNFILILCILPWIAGLFIVLLGFFMSTKSIKVSYLRGIVFYFISFGFLYFLTVIIFSYGIKGLITEFMFIDIFIVFFIVPWVGALLIVLLSPKITCFLVWLRIKLFKNYSICIKEINEDLLIFQRFPWKRTILPTFLSFAFATLIIKFFGIFQEIWEYFMYYSLIVILLLPFSILITSVNWVADDAGILHYKNNLGRELPDIEGVGRWWNTLLKGYAGLSYIFGWLMNALIIAPIYNLPYYSMYGLERFFLDLTYFILAALFPLLLCLLVIPSLFLYELFFERIKKINSSFKEQYCIKQKLVLEVYGKNH
ncbi:MAG: hypothetical protein ACTSPD_13920 [Promethearchaeota archaeon]